MLGHNKAQTLEVLKQQVARIEAQAVVATDAPSSGSKGFFPSPHGVVHEVFTDSLINTGAALGYAIGSAKSLLSPARPGLFVLQMSSDAQETGLPYGPGFKLFGLDPQSFVLIRTDTLTELLWAMEEAIACHAVAALIADIAYPHKALDFTVSRRLALRTAASGASVFIVRYGTGREASAARFRWNVEPALSGPMPFDRRAPGPPRWQVTLEKGRLSGQHNGLAEGQTVLVDWTENGFVSANSDSRTVSRTAGAPALSGAASAALADRLSEAG